MSLITILVLLAFISAVLATFLVPARINLTALSLAFWFASLLLKGGSLL